MNVRNIIGVCKDTAKKIFRKHGTTILVVAGSVGTVGAGVWAVRNTIKYDVKDIIDSAKNELDAISDRVANEGEEYDKRDGRREAFHVLLRTAGKLAKAYAGPAGLQVASLGSIGLGVGVLETKAASLAANVVGLESTIAGMRERTAERLGAEAEEDIRYAIRKEKVVEKQIDENGNEVVVEKEIDVSDYDGFSETARFLNETTSDVFYRIPSAGHVGKDILPSPYELECFLTAQQNVANSILQLEGTDCYMLNDMYRQLGLTRSTQGCTQGWLPGDTVQLTCRHVSRPIIDKDTGENLGWQPDLLVGFNCHDISGFFEKTEKPKRVLLA